VTFKHWSDLRKWHSPLPILIACSLYFDGNSKYFLVLYYFEGNSKYNKIQHIAL
jgi:hypothetical protein